MRSFPDANQQIGCLFCFYLTGRLGQCLMQTLRLSLKISYSVMYCPSLSFKKKQQKATQLAKGPSTLLILFSIVAANSRWEKYNRASIYDTSLLLFKSPFIFSSGKDCVNYLLVGHNSVWIMALLFSFGAAKDSPYNKN